MIKQSNSSWESSSRWYDGIVGSEGHYYHKNLILPKLLKMMDLKSGDKLLDLACGQGVLARSLSPEIPYLGVDLSPSLIHAAKIKAGKKHVFLVGDVTEPLKTQEKGFTHGAIILAVQNLKNPLGAFNNAASLLTKGGKLFLVLNHPYFRIPRQSSWGEDISKKLQYRRVDRYMTPMEIPIAMHPGKEADKSTLSFHYPLSMISNWLHEAGFYIETIEEWCSDKLSTGIKAKMENRARKEFPLFMSITALFHGEL